jgi:hypothetical protein
MARSLQNVWTRRLKERLAKGELSRRAYVVGLELGMKHGRDLAWDQPVLTYERLGRSCGYSRRTVQDAIAELVELLGLQIERRYRHVGGKVRQIAPRYRFPAELQRLRDWLGSVRSPKSATPAPRSVSNTDRGPETTRRRSGSSSRRAVRAINGLAYVDLAGEITQAELDRPVVVRPGVEFRHA